MTINHTFACDSRAQEVRNLVQEILRESWLQIQVVQLQLTENFETSRAELSAKLVEIADGQAKTKQIIGDGVGLVDACFDAMIKSYGNHYCSLDTLSIV